MAFSKVFFKLFTLDLMFNLGSGATKAQDEISFFAPRTFLIFRQAVLDSPP
jgi:hypothetical protein